MSEAVAGCILKTEQYKEKARKTGTLGQYGAKKFVLDCTLRTQKKEYKRGTVIASDS